MPPAALAIDLRGLSFMDSTGVHALMSTGLHCQDHGQRFFVIRGDRHINYVLTTGGIDGWFELVDTPDQLPDDAFTFDHRL